MTLAQMVEKVRISFPEAGETLIAKELQSIYEEFLDDTNLLSRTDMLVFGTIQTEDEATILCQDGESIIYSEYGYYFALPADFNRLIKVDYFDGQNIRVPLLLINSFVRDGKVYFTDSKGNAFRRWPSSVDKIALRYHSKGNLLADSDTPEIPLRFHESLVEGALARFHARAGNLQMAAYYKQLAREARLEGRRHANKGGKEGFDVKQRGLV